MAKKKITREIYPLVRKSQRNANYIKARIDKTQQNNKCRLRDNRDKTINDITIQCAKEEYKTRHD